LQPQVSDERNTLLPGSSEALSSHEKKQQSLAKLITGADVEGTGAASVELDIVVEFA